MQKGEFIICIKVKLRQGKKGIIFHQILKDLYVCQFLKDMKYMNIQTPKFFYGEFRIESSWMRAVSSLKCNGIG